MSMADKFAELKREHKPALDSDLVRHNRDKAAVRLRKADRAARLTKRRQGLSGKADSKTEGEREDKKSTMGPRSDVVAKAIAELPSFVALLNPSNGQEQIKEALQKLRKLSSIETEKPPLDEMASVPRLLQTVVQFLRADAHSELQFEAAWLITNLASTDSKKPTQVIVDAGVLPLLGQLIVKSSSQVREQAVWALANIAGDDPKHRNNILHSGIVPLLANIIVSTTELHLLRTTIWCIWNICRGGPEPIPMETLAVVVTAVAKLLSGCTDVEAVTDACWIIKDLTVCGDEARVGAAIKCGCAAPLVKLLMHDDLEIKQQAIRCVANLLTGTNEMSDVLLKCGALPALSALLSHSVKEVRRLACWALSNITAGSSAQIEQVLSAGVHVRIIDKLLHGENDVKIEAMFAVCNFGDSGTPEQMQALIKENAVQATCGMLGNASGKGVHLALEALHKFIRVGQKAVCTTIEECGGRTALEKIRDDREKDDELYKMSDDLLTGHFDKKDGAQDEDDDMTVLLAPEETGSAFAFSASKSVPSGAFVFGQPTESKGGSVFGSSKPELKTPGGPFGALTQFGSTVTGFATASSPAGTSAFGFSATHSAFAAPSPSPFSPSTWGTAAAPAPAWATAQTASAFAMAEPF